MNFKLSVISGNSVYINKFFFRYFYVVSVVEWLQRRNCDQHGTGSKPTHAILLCSW